MTDTFLYVVCYVRYYVYVHYVYFCRTSTDLFKTVFDLMVSVTLFVGRFDMRMMQVCSLSLSAFVCS